MTSEYQNYLAHYGVKGMRWGDHSMAGTVVSKYTSKKEARKEEKAHKKIEKDAEKDASEYARAQAYYGEGAGNRRKAVKNKLSEKMKDPAYKEAFDRHLAQQNMAKAQSAAIRERKVRDTAKVTKKAARKTSIFLLSNGPTLLRVARAVSGMV